LVHVATRSMPSELKRKFASDPRIRAIFQGDDGVIGCPKEYRPWCNLKAFGDYLTKYWDIKLKAESSGESDGFYTDYVMSTGTVRPGGKIGIQFLKRRFFRVRYTTPGDSLDSEMKITVLPCREFKDYAVRTLRTTQVMFGQGDMGDLKEMIYFRYRWRGLMEDMHGVCIRGHDMLENLMRWMDERYPAVKETIRRLEEDRDGVDSPSSPGYGARNYLKKVLPDEDIDWVEIPDICAIRARYLPDPVKQDERKWRHMSNIPTSSRYARW